MYEFLINLPSYAPILLYLGGVAGSVAIAYAAKAAGRRRKFGTGAAWAAAVLCTASVMFAIVAPVLLDGEWDRIEDRAVAEAVNSKYGTTLTSDQVRDLSPSRPSLLTIDGERVACVLETSVSGTSEPTVHKVHLICGEELPVVG